MRPLWVMPLLQRQRYLLIGIFCFGFIVVIISIVRIPTLRHGASSPDPTFTNVQTALWSLAELETAILCTSLPILRPIVARFMRGVAPPDAAEGQMKGPHGQGQNVEEVRRGPRQLPGESLLIPTEMTGSTLKSATQQFKSKTSTIDEEVGPPPLPSKDMGKWPHRAPEREERLIPSPLGSNPPDSIKDVVVRSSVGHLRSPTYDEMLPPHILENGAPRRKAKMATRGTQTVITWDPLVDPFQVPEAIEQPGPKEVDLEANRTGAGVGHERGRADGMVGEVRETISPLASDRRSRRENADARSVASRSTRGNRRAAGISWLRLSGDSGFNSSRYWER